MDKELELKRIIDLFLSSSIRDIKQEEECPNINFKFNDDVYDYFNSFINDGENRPFHADIKDLKYFREHLNDGILDVRVNDPEEFFNHLKDIINENNKLYYEYDMRMPVWTVGRNILRRIWLRMGVDDVENVSRFLENQSQFLKNRTFDSKVAKKICKFGDYDVEMKTRANRSWDESTRCMIFSIVNEQEEYNLPRILYDINDSNVCYIYGLQGMKNDKARGKKIERELYKLNKGIENPTVHPNKVLSLLLFIDQLKSKGITKVIVPGVQVLSYRYHELLSEKSKRQLEVAQTVYDNDPDDYSKNELVYTKEWYEHVYEKQDKISYLKTEELINLVYRVIEHNPDIEILNDINLQGDSLNLKI